MPEVVGHLEKYHQEFLKHFGEVDELALIVLKSHLIIEAALDNLMALIFFHPHHVHDGRFSFVHKVQMARAYCLRKNQNAIWGQILAINALRNEVAHSLEGDNRAQRLQKVRGTYLAGADANLKKAHQEASDNEIVLFACAECVGFLAEFEKDVSCCVSLLILSTRR